MPVTHYAQRYAQRRIIHKATRAIPWLGAALAAAAVVSTIRRKGLVHGTLDTALTAMPVVGTLKFAAEAIRGRDFFPDRRPGGIRRPPAVSHG